jgi:NADPH-dependent 2,4-dienoyl-CoA reductase/sulfur reductase-like enzyme
MPSRQRSVDVLLIGGGVASARCARTLRRRGFQGSILMVGDEPRLPYNRPPLSKELLRGEVPDELIAVEPESWYARQHIEVQTGVSVDELHVAEHQSVMSDGTRVGFERCLLATGAEPRRPTVPGVEHAMLLRTAGDAAAIRERANAAPEGAAAVVVGGGFIGVEVAGSLATHGLRVTVLERSSQLWRGTLGETVSNWAVGVLARSAVQVRFGVAATKLDAAAVWVEAERLQASLAVIGVGVIPRTQLAERAGLTVDDGVVVDESQAAAPGLFAAGDIARAPNAAADGPPIRVEHWHSARESAEAAALGMLGQPVPPARAPWVYTEFAGQLVEIVGWAPDRDGEQVLGEPATDRFAVAFLRGARVAQLAVANGYIPVEAARSFVEARRDVGELAALVTT